MEALKVKLFGDEKAALLKRYTDNVEAYQLCLKARYSWYKWTEVGFKTAVDLFERALRIDPNYALAHFGLGDCYVAWSMIGFPMPEARPKMKGLLEKALELDPALADAYAVYGIAQGLIEWDWPGAERSFKTAMTLNPRSAHVCSGYGLLLTLIGRGDEAIKMSRRGIELDPLSPFWNFNLSEVYCALGKYEDALRQSASILELEPRYWLAHSMKGMCLGALGRIDEAVTAAELAVQYSGGVALAVGQLGQALALAGRREEAAQKLSELNERAKMQWVSALSRAFIHCGLDQPDQAFAALEQAWQFHEGWLVYYLKCFPALDRLRPDPRLADLLRRVGLV